VLARCWYDRAADLGCLVPVEVLAEVNTTVTVLGNLRPGGQPRAAAAGSGDHGGLKAVNLAEVTDDQCQLVTR
jgi:hypothetical protein